MDELEIVCLRLLLKKFLTTPIDVTRVRCAKKLLIHIEELIDKDLVDGPASRRNDD